MVVPDFVAFGRWPLDGRHGNIGDRFNAVQCAARVSPNPTPLSDRTFVERWIYIRILFLTRPKQPRIEADIFELEGEVEVGLDRDGRRWALVAFAEDVVEEVKPLTSDDTWLVSGGGSGGDRSVHHRCGRPAPTLVHISNCSVAQRSSRPRLRVGGMVG